MKTARLNELLSALPGATVAVLGDFCLDAYWTMDDASSERSLGYARCFQGRIHGAVGDAATDGKEKERKQL